MEKEIDWSPFDGDPESDCTCGCGQHFRSHVKAFYGGGHRVAYSRKPCPRCGRNDNVKGMRSDWEPFSIGQ